jgi:hypothetical protein
LPSTTIVPTTSRGSGTARSPANDTRASSIGLPARNPIAITSRGVTA